MNNKLFKEVLCFVLVQALLSLCLVGKSSAVPAAPVLHLLKQSDGTEFSARQWGDEWAHGWETMDGYSIVLDERRRDWKYAVTGKSGRLVASQSVVHRDLPPRNLKKRLRPSGKRRKQILTRRSAAFAATAAGGSAVTPQSVVPPTGAGNIPVILVNFNNTTTTYSSTDFDTRLFGTGNKSMKDYYEEVSYGAFTVSAGPSGVVGWYTASKRHDYYGRNDAWGYDVHPAELVIEAVQNADAAGFNFAPYDMDGDCYVDVVAVVHQGSGEEAGGPATDIWSHRWDLNSAAYYGDGSGVYTTNDSAACGSIKVNDYIIQPETLFGGQQTMGVFAHEYGHALGLPDLYDIDYTSEGIGEWGLMASGSWNSVTTPGDTPAHMSAWSKYFLGWVSPVPVSGALSGEPIEQAATAPDVYQFLPGSPSAGGEYFLVENRQRAPGSFDEGLPGSGLAIWHIDEAMAASGNANECSPPSNCSTTHYQVALVQADHQWDLERGTNGGDSGDLYPGSGGNTSFTDTSAPDSDLYDGSPSNVFVASIGASGSVMTATLSDCATRIYYRDADGDTYGDPNVTTEECVQPAGYVSDNTDCDDADNTAFPGAPELCDTKDTDCDSGTADGSGEGWYGNPTICGVGVCSNVGQLTCSGGTQTDTCIPGGPTETPETSCADGLDNDCDAHTDSADSDCYVAGDIAPRGAPDGVVNTADALVAMRIATGQIAPTQTELDRGDVAPLGGPDGVIDISDALLIQRKAAGLTDF